MKQFRFITATYLVALVTAGPVTGDSIRFEGSSIAIENCRIERIDAGRVVYRDSRSRQFTRSLDDVRALGFDGLEALEAAETTLEAHDLELGLRHLLQALLGAETDLQRLWVHARLSRTHDVRGEAVQAAGHAAAVFLIDDDGYWRVLEPVSPPDAPPFAASKEAYDLLRKADKQITTGELAPVIDRMLRMVRPVHRRIAKTYNGPSISPDSTISGFDRDIVATQAFAELQPRVPEAPDEASKSATRRPGAKPAAPSDHPEAIDRLLAEQRYAEALAACERVAQRPGDRSLSRFLFQYGQAMAATGRTRDAAVMFTRCAVLYPETIHAVDSLIETARIYRDTYNEPDTARRLLYRAIAAAESRDNTDAAARARTVLGTLEAEPGQATEP